jgi:hypothetical protein
MRKILNKMILAVRFFLHRPLHRTCVQCLLHNQLHRTQPLQPKHDDFSLAPELHPLENARYAKYNSCCGTEGRGFKPRRLPQIFQTLGFVSRSRELHRVAQRFGQSHRMEPAFWHSFEGVPLRRRLRILRGVRCAASLRECVFLCSRLSCTLA